MTEWRRTIVRMVWVGALLAGCGGGSGSTGLITSETALIDDVRREGNCGEFDGAPYCATDSTDATAPGGQSASVVAIGSPTPVSTPAASASASEPTASPTFDVLPTSTPGAAAPTPTAGGPTPTSAGGIATPTPTAAGTLPTSTATAAAGRTATPLPSATPADVPVVTAVIDGFEPGAACAVAARPAGSEDAWQTGPLVTLGQPGQPVAFPVPTGVPPPRELVLLCFAAPPALLPSELTTLADAEPTVVFVLP